MINFECLLKMPRRRSCKKHSVQESAHSPYNSHRKTNQNGDAMFPDALFSTKCCQMAAIAML